MSTQQAAHASQSMAQTTHDLSVAAASGDRAAVGDALGHVERQGCGACHLPVAR
jgi:cytochrome c551/c552